MIINTIFTTLQVILILTIWMTCKNKKDKVMAWIVISYLALLTGALWIA